MKKIQADAVVGYLFLTCFYDEVSTMTTAFSANCGYLDSLAGMSQVSVSAPPKSVLKGPEFSRDYVGNTVVPSAVPSPEALFASPKPKAIATTTGYLGNLEAADATMSTSLYYTPATTVPTAITKTTAATATARLKAPVFSPFGSKPKAVVTTGYLGNLATTPPSTMASAPTAGLTSATSHNTATATGSAAPNIMKSSSMKRPTSYSPFGSKPKEVATTGYLGNLGTTHASTTTTGPAPTRSTMTTAESSGKRPNRSFSPFGQKPQAVATTGYLGNLAASEGFSMMTTSTFYTPSATVPTSATKMTTSTVKPPTDYYNSPFGFDHSKPQPETVDMTTMTSSSIARNQPPSYSPFGQKPKVVATTGYLGTLNVVVMTSTVSAPASSSSSSSSSTYISPVMQTSDSLLGTISLAEIRSSKENARDLSTLARQDLYKVILNSQTIGSTLLAELEAGKRAVAIKAASKKDDVQDVEALAQLAGTICLNSHPGIKPGSIFFFAGVNGVKWQKPVMPRDLLVMEVEMKWNSELGLARATGRAYVDGTLAVVVDEMNFATADSPSVPNGI